MNVNEILHLSCKKWMNGCKHFRKFTEGSFKNVSLFSVMWQRELHMAIEPNIDTYEKKGMPPSLPFVLTVSRSSLSVITSLHIPLSFFFSLSMIHTHTLSFSLSYSPFSSFFFASLACSYRFPIFISVFSIYSFYFFCLLSPSLFSVSFFRLPFRYNGARSSLLFRILHGYLLRNQWKVLSTITRDE